LIRHIPSAGVLVRELMTTAEEGLVRLN
jgi:hypothetical protein